MEDDLIDPHYDDDGNLIDDGPVDQTEEEEVLKEDCDSTGSRVPILPGTDSTGSYRVLLLYTTVGLSYRRSHLQRPLRS